MYSIVSNLFSGANTISIVVLVILLFGTSNIKSLHFGRKPCLEHRTPNRKYKWQAWRFLAHRWDYVLVIRQFTRW